jgi:hypothetical protein
MMASGTPMGATKPGSRLDRLSEAQQLLRKLQAVGMTREQIGQAIGRRVGTVGKWARGERAPSVKQIEQIRRLLPPDGAGPLSSTF